MGAGRMVAFVLVRTVFGGGIGRCCSRFGLGEIGPVGAVAVVNVWVAGTAVLRE